MLQKMPSSEVYSGVQMRLLGHHPLCLSTTRPWTTCEDDLVSIHVHQTCIASIHAPSIAITAGFYPSMSEDPMRVPQRKAIRNLSRGSR